jgi:hypothetical protein
LLVEKTRVVNVVTLPLKADLSSKIGALQQSSGEEGRQCYSAGNSSGKQLPHGRGVVLSVAGMAEECYSIEIA